jgi:hypothetical protein
MFGAAWVTRSGDCVVTRSLAPLSSGGVRGVDRDLPLFHLRLIFWMVAI